jgi:hypothetical protein
MQYTETDITLPGNLKISFIPRASNRRSVKVFGARTELYEAFLSSRAYLTALDLLVSCDLKAMLQNTATLKDCSDEERVVFGLLFQIRDYSGTEKLHRNWEVIKRKRAQLPQSGQTASALQSLKDSDDAVNDTDSESKYIAYHI